MANAHVSLPKPFASGNIHEWFVRFDIHVCSDVNKWDDETKTVKLPTLLEGEALATWLELSTEAKKTYAKTKKELIAAMTSTSFTTLERFRQRKWSLAKGCQCSLSGKLQRGVCRGQQTPCAPVSPLEAVFVASIRSGVSVVDGLAVSLVRHDIAKRFNGRASAGDTPRLRLVLTGEEELPIVNNVKAAVKLSGIEEVPEHCFIVVEQLISQVISGVSREGAPEPEALQAIWKGERERREKVCIVASPDYPASDEADECVIPIFNEFADAEFPGFVKPCFEETVRQARDRFVKTPGLTKLTCHQTDTVGSPARVPPRRIPAHFQQEQLVASTCSLHQEEDRRNPTMCGLPRSKQEDKKGCAYPLPLIDEVEDHLSGATVFSKLDLQCGYWQIPVDPKDQEKTAFSPGPGMGFFQFTRMPFGLHVCGAPSTFQRLMDVVMRGLPFVTTYIDDVLIHSANEELHKSHLEQAFQRLREAGPTPRGSKCQIRMFANIAAPLHQLTQKDTPFQWTQKSEESFQRLKACLTEAPVLAYPWFVKHAGTMVLQTDSSNVGLGVVLEQVHVQRVFGYASHTLTKAEANYSVIHLAIVWAMKQFRHYLLGRTFQLMTDHAPLQWLAVEIRQSQQHDKKTLQLKYHPGPMSDTFVVPVLPEALHQQALSMCHDSQAASHQGTHTMPERIRREAYWVNMAQDMKRHCRECVTCQKSKLTMPVRSPFTNIPIGRPWQMIVIDILEVPLSTKNSRYLLVIQDYFTKWADARSLPDQTAIRITAELVKLFCTYDIPEIVHSDQGQNFESSIVQSTLDAFGAVLQAKMAELQGLVEAHIVESAHWQKVDYDRHSAEWPFKLGDLVWLSVPTAGKLDPRWEGNWTVRRVKSPVTVEISDEERTKVVHTNRLHIRIQPAANS
eukprot:Em0001g3079a